MATIWVEYAKSMVALCVFTFDSSPSHLLVTSNTSKKNLRNIKGTPKEDRKGSLDLLLAFSLLSPFFVESRASA